MMMTRRYNTTNAGFRVEGRTGNIVEEWREMSDSSQARQLSKTRVGLMDVE
jgi:hypothetical protein